MITWHAPLPMLPVMGKDFWCGICTGTIVKLEGMGRGRKWRHLFRYGLNR